jgi:DNA-binding IclR family transcriptional regulator
VSRSLEAKSIKSAQRVFEVLEFFDEDHPEASVSDIARRYGYPQSSTSELLSYMVSLGYLRRRRNRTFCLSMRVAMLGSWVQPQLTRSSRILKAMDELADATGGSVVLASNSGVRVQCLHAVRRHADAPRQGDQLHLLHSAEGRALLITCDRNLVRKYVHRLNAEANDESGRIRYDDLARDLDDASGRRYARTVGGERLVVAILIPNADQSEQLALSVCVSDDADEEALVRAMRSIVSSNLGLIDVRVALPGKPAMPQLHRQLAVAAR